MVDFLSSSSGFLGETVIIGDETFSPTPIQETLEDSTTKIDILSQSIQQSGLNNKNNTWDTETDALLDSILTGSDEKLVLGLDRPFSDTSSDSGCNLLSPSGNNIDHPGSPIDLIGYLSNDNEDFESPLQAVNPVTFDDDEEEEVEDDQSSTTSNNDQQQSPLQSAHTTIVMPVMSSVRQTINLNDAINTDKSKRRRVSNSSNDSGVSSNSSNPTKKMKGSGNQKYPALILTAEEERLCEREGIKLPSHYPLSREEEKNLKRIRRKIRNKESAQNSRKRKKEYVEDMEDRVKMCTDENQELKSKIAHLEKQNKTLAGQLKRLHQIIVNGGGIKQNQTSTAMMVLLLSTALFLLPGFQKQNEGKPELDISQAVKQVPMAGSSRSLLHFANIKQEFVGGEMSTEQQQGMVNENVVVNAATTSAKSILGKRSLPFMTDHDYLSLPPASLSNKRMMASSSYIEDDVPPKGYGPNKIAPESDGRKLNVNVSHSAVRTVVLHVPKDIK